MTRRITINLVAFAALAVLMVVWAFNNVVRFDFIDRPYHITVEFESSPGLHPNFEVDYLGLRIGKIDSVRLEKDKVVVKLDIDSGVKIPQGVTAAAARKSAVGEPVVELTPGPGTVNAPAMKPGARIPVSQTKVPPKYGDLFGAVIDSLKTINPEDAKTVTHELAEGWSGRESSLRQIIAGGDQLTATFAENTEMLDQLTSDLSRITGVLNANRGQLGGGVDNLAAVTASLSQVRGQIAELRDRGPDLLATVNRLLAETTPDFECTVDALGDWGLKRYNPQLLRDLNSTLAKAPQLRTVLNNVIGIDQGQPVLNVVFQVTVTKTATLEYQYPLAQPKLSTVPTCAGGRTPALVKQKPYKAKNPGATIPTHDPSVNDQGAKLKNAANSSKDSSSGPPVWLVYVPPVLALLVLIKVMMGSVPVVSRLPRLRRRGED
ncbi:MCE family protein [Spirillospora albida]|uniref:MCE family protein n=1 Tax=Spirillospora albida TaxID=58123 RepID=UPI0004C1C144|nr:MCE family protein [Spirillospora albida]